MFEFIDKITDEEIASGAVIQTALFDKRVLFPLAQLPELVAGESGENLDPARLPALRAAGWFPVLSSEIVGVDEGVPMYIPSRVGLLLKLEREGFTAPEIEAFAAFEEGVIDEILVDEETPYEDDDLKLLLAARRGMLATLQATTRAQSEGWVEATGLPGVDDLPEQMAALERNIAALESYIASGGMSTLAPKHQARLRRNAIKVRFANEFTRLMMVQQDRAQMGAGYSHFICFRRFQMNGGLALDSYTFSDICWGTTVRDPRGGARDSDEALPIRLPGLVLRGEQVTMTRRMSPTEYRRLMDEYNIDEYHRAYAALQGERLCIQCLAPIPSGSSPRRQYCSEACRNAAKQATYRERRSGWVKERRVYGHRTSANGLAEGEDE